MGPQQPVEERRLFELKSIFHREQQLPSSQHLTITMAAKVISEANIMVFTMVAIMAAIFTRILIVMAIMVTVDLDTAFSSRLPLGTA